VDTLIATVAEINESLSKAAQSVQDQVLATHREAAAALAALPEAPSWLPVRPAPVGDVKLDEIVTRAFDAQIAQLESSRQFALGLVDIWTAKPTSRSSRKA
jgi:hypothetical protein